MWLIARVLGLSLLMGLLATGTGVALFGPQYSDYIIPALFLGCVGGIIGAVAGAAREVVVVLRQRAAG